MSSAARRLGAARYEAARAWSEKNAGMQSCHGQRIEAKEYLVIMTKVQFEHALAVAFSAGVSEAVFVKQVAQR